MTWTDDHGEDGLRREFDVYKAKDALHRDESTATFPEPARIGADGEFIFVLRPESDEAAAMVLDAYARRVKHRAPQLADDIRCELRRIRVANERITP